MAPALLDGVVDDQAEALDPEAPPPQKTLNGNVVLNNSPNKALAEEGFLLMLYRIAFVDQDCSLSGYLSLGT